MSGTLCIDSLGTLLLPDWVVGDYVPINAHTTTTTIRGRITINQSGTLRTIILFVSTAHPHASIVLIRLFCNQMHGRAFFTLRPAGCVFAAY